MMRFIRILLAVTLWPVCAEADYFRGLDSLERRDVARAIKELTPQADAGEADAQDALGVAYDRSNIASGTTRARALFRTAAENGLLLGMLNLARMLQSGRGGPANPAEAAEWLTRAAQGGSADGMAKLADAYRNGFGVPLDKVNAQTWYERAAKLNHPAGMAGVADMMFESSDPAVRLAGRAWLERASDRGNPHAQQELALAKMLGLSGVPKDEAGSAALSRSAALQGDALGAVMLAEDYRDGHGVAASEADAVHWYAEAARLGAVRGQFETARLKLAPGPNHDVAGAYFWAQVAARRPGILQAAISSLDRAASEQLTPAQQAQIRARAAEWQPGAAPQ